MFGSKSKSQPEPAPVQEPVVEAAPERTVVREAAPAASMKNYISAGTVIEGNIISHEDLRLDGKVKGDVKTSARLWLGKDSVVEGNILAAEAEVAGRITGTVESKGLLAIKSTCRIEGDIATKSLNVESGSSFNGRCKVGGEHEPDSAKAMVASRLKQAAPAAPPMPAKAPGAN
ncbi:MAG: polymer-forming cytoskeletal protein [Planctomycetaceae bacterium]